MQKNYQNRARFDKVIAKIIWCSFDSWCSNMPSNRFTDMSVIWVNSF